MKFFKIIIIVSIFASIFGCSQKQNETLKNIKIENSEGFADITFNIVNKEQDNNYTTFIAKGLYENKVVGIKVLILNNIEPGLLNNEVSQNGFRKNGIILKSIGKESDEFLKALSVIYSIKSSGKFNSNDIYTTVFSLNSNKTDFNSKNYYKFKIFLNDELGEEDYAELYLNVNLQQNELGIFEKDTEYRNAVIKAFSE